MKWNKRSTFVKWSKYFHSIFMLNVKNAIFKLRILIRQPNANIMRFHIRQITFIYNLFQTAVLMHYNLEMIKINFSWQSLWLLVFHSFVVHVPRSTNMLHTTFKIVFDKLIKVCQIQNAFKLWKMQILLASYYKITFCIMQNKRFLQHLLIFSFYIKNFFAYIIAFISGQK